MQALTTHVNVAQHVQQSCDFTELNLHFPADDIIQFEELDCRVAEDQEFSSLLVSWLLNTHSHNADWLLATTSMYFSTNVLCDIYSSRKNVSQDYVDLPHILQLRGPLTSSWQIDFKESSIGRDGHPGRPGTTWSKVPSKTQIWPKLSLVRIPSIHFICLSLSLTILFEYFLWVIF